MILFFTQKQLGLVIACLSTGTILQASDKSFNLVLLKKNGFELFEPVRQTPKSTPPDTSKPGYPVISEVPLTQPDFFDSKTPKKRLACIHDGSANTPGKISPFASPEKQTAEAKDRNSINKRVARRLSFGTPETPESNSNNQREAWLNNDTIIEAVQLISACQADALPRASKIPAANKFIKNWLPILKSLEELIKENNKIHDPKSSSDYAQGFDRLKMNIIDLIPHTLTQFENPEAIKTAVSFDFERLHEDLIKQKLSTVFKENQHNLIGNNYNKTTKN